MKKKAWIPEWSKGSDLSSDAVSFVGSNPTSCIFSHLNSKCLNLVNDENSSLSSVG